ncbi:MAG: S8 family serine peptidase, partial [Candidatus Doudnabacteria bacterium]|nr:S8 family serine peptidase [Candidatus Doudnabacteria bacterium]
MKQDPRFAYAEADKLVAAAAVTTNDPYFTTDSSLEDRQWYLGKIKISEAWQYGTGSSSVTVAIVDTGIHASHVELNDGRVVAGYNTITNQDILPGSDSDDNGHGTAVAGVIGAIPNNAKGLAGINWNVKLMPVKALEANGTGLVSSVASAIVWAADHGANIINLSLGGSGFDNDPTLNNAIIYAFNKGAVIVAAAGNDLAAQGSNLDTKPVYPVCADAGANLVIGVAATDSTDRKTAFSNFGINCVDIAAPGKKILTTTFLPSDPGNNILIYGSGTSLAAPIVSAVAALLKANNVNLSNVDIRNILLKTADNIDALNQNNCLNTSCNGFLGKGRINALSALSPQPILDQSLVRDAATGQIYLIQGGNKRLVSDFVFQQRGLSLANVVSDTTNQLSNLPSGYPLPPLDGTLIKGDTDATVYIIHQDLRRALTYLVFVSRGFSFANVVTLPQTYVNSLQAGDWYWPPDQTMVLIAGNPTVYVMNEGVRRPVTYFVFIQRKLSFAKVVSVTADEFSHIPPAPDAYWLAPLDGTLVKSASDATVYVVENATKRPLSYSAFVSRGYK